MDTGRTRSGKSFRPLESAWDNTTNLLLTVLACYLDHSSLLKGRLVCKAWCASFSSHVRKLQLQPPASAFAARSLARHIATRFDAIRTLHVTLLDDPGKFWDFTGDEDQPQLCVPGEQQRNSAAVVLMKGLGAMGTIQELQVVTPVDSECRCLPALLQPMPQLRVLDLSQCAHEPNDLLVTVQHMPQLQQLLLHCQSFTTLSGRRVRHGNNEWPRHGGNTRYQKGHMAALAQLPCLQHLECASPTWLTTQEIRMWLDAVGQLTGLTALHLAHKHDGYWYDDKEIKAPGSSLSRLTCLRALRCHAGTYSNTWQQGQDWGSTLSCMPHLTRLELINVEAQDPVLLAIGTNTPHLQRLVLDSHDLRAYTSAAGADAIRHVGHIELVWVKPFYCKANRELVRLPGIKRMLHLPLRREASSWSRDVCPCCECVGERYRAANGH